MRVLINWAHTEI